MDNKTWYCALFKRERNKLKKIKKKHSQPLTGRKALSVVICCCCRYYGDNYRRASKRIALHNREWRNKAQLGSQLLLRSSCLITISHFFNESIMYYVTCTRWHACDDVHVMKYTQRRACDMHMRTWSWWRDVGTVLENCYMNQPLGLHHMSSRESERRTRAAQANKWCEWTSKRTSFMAQYSALWFLIIQLIL